MRSTFDFFRGRGAYVASAWIMSAAFSAIMIAGRLVFPDTSVGSIESTIHRSPGAEGRRKKMMSPYDIVRFRLTLGS